MTFQYDSFFGFVPFVPLQQHPHFAAALAGMGRKMDTIALPGSGTAQVLMRKVWPFPKAARMVSRGPIWSIPPQLETEYKAAAALRDAGVHLINNEGVSPDALKAAGYRQIMTPATIAMLDLRDTQQARVQAMTAKWRNALRKASHAGLSIDVQSYDTSKHRWILTADAVQQKARRYRALSRDLVQSYAVMNKGQVTVVTASDGDTPLSAMVFLKHGASATYQIGWTSTAGRAANAHNLCLSIAMDSLSACGVRMVDLGQIDTINLPGLARFKLGSGAEAITLGGTWLRIPGLPIRPLA